MKILRPISEKYVTCGLLIDSHRRYCGRHATSGVLFPEGLVLWRCTKHRGIRKVDINDHAVEWGHVVTEVVEDLKS